MPDGSVSFVSSVRIPRMNRKSVLRSTVSVLLVAVTLTRGVAEIRAENKGDREVGQTSEERWVRPDNNEQRPLWGVRGGICVGLPPLPGPRGLLRIYAPYLDQPKNHVINYIAIEPTTAEDKVRGLSELEHSALDGTRGKRLWSANAAESAAAQSAPAAGVIEQLDSVECLRVYIYVERFENGADVYLQLTFRADRPHEVGIATFAKPDSKPLQNCTVTATMGNYARLRTLLLGSQKVAVSELWPKYSGSGFTPHRFFPLSELQRDSNGEAIVSAEPDEADPEAVTYEAGTREGWRYRGAAARQYWRVVKPDAGLQACVNGRRVYWNSDKAIPGGVAFENFELVAPFEQGQEFWFGAEPMVIKSE
jgi:hypothetical protein